MPRHRAARGIKAWTVRAWSSPCWITARSRSRILKRAGRHGSVFFYPGGSDNFSLCPGSATSAFGSGAASPYANCVTLTGSTFDCNHGTHVAGTVAGNWGFYDKATRPTLIQSINMGGVARGADLIPIQVFTYILDCNTSVPGNQPVHQQLQGRPDQRHQLCLQYIVFGRSWSADHTTLPRST